MSDEGGSDSKVLAVPHDKLTTLYTEIKEPQDLGSLLLDQIAHFFENYKDLEDGKWVKVDGWRGAEAAREAVIASVEAAKK
jgi:inorganic pyrophosphatase